MAIFENILTDNIHNVIPKLKIIKEDFYLAGGTALALQLGHRQSIDLDFFTTNEFDNELIISALNPSSIQANHKNTIHCIINDVRVTLLYYSVPLIEPKVEYTDLKIAHINDVIAEKFKTVSQRGAKKDFCDLYASFKTYCSIEDGCGFFSNRFQNTGINFYTVLKSLTYFIDADNDPDPIWFDVDYSNKWEDIKNFFIGNLKLFKENLINLR